MKGPDIQPPTLVGSGTDAAANFERADQETLPFRGDPSLCREERHPRKWLRPSLDETLLEPWHPRKPGHRVLLTSYHSMTQWWVTQARAPERYGRAGG
jgi:hypothetical protein